MTDSESSPRNRTRRFLRFAILFFLSVFIFIGGGAALLYLLFSKYTGVQNIWLLVCGAPVILVVLLFLTLINLYFRFGRPLEQLFNAIDEVEEGNLSIRVPEAKSDMFSELMRWLVEAFSRKRCGLN